MWSQGDPHEWSAEEVATFLRSLGPAECFQSDGDAVLQYGVDGSVFFELSLTELQGLCGHALAYARMCECKHSSTHASAITVAPWAHTPQSYTFRMNSESLRMCVCMIQLLAVLVKATSVRHQSRTQL